MTESANDSGPAFEIEAWATRIKFAQIAAEESRRTYLVSTAALAVGLEALVAAHGLSHLVKVMHSPYVPADSIVVMDEQAIEADQREAMMRLGREMWRP